METDSTKTYVFLFSRGLYRCIDNNISNELIKDMSELSPENLSELNS